MTVLIITLCGQRLTASRTRMTLEEDGIIQATFDPLFTRPKGQSLTLKLYSKECIKITVYRRYILVLILKRSGLHNSTVC